MDLKYFPTPISIFLKDYPFQKIDRGMRLIRSRMHSTGVQRSKSWFGMGKKIETFVTIYEINIQLGGIYPSWTIERQFSDFINFYNMLINDIESTYPDYDIELIPKLNGGNDGNDDYMDVIERTESIVAFLKFILVTIDPLLYPPLYDFLDMLNGVKNLINKVFIVQRAFKRSFRKWSTRQLLLEHYEGEMKYFWNLLITEGIHVFEPCRYIGTGRYTSANSNMLGSFGNARSSSLGGIIGDLSKNGGATTTDSKQEGGISSPPSPNDERRNSNNNGRSSRSRVLWLEPPTPNSRCGTARLCVGPLEVFEMSALNSNIRKDLAKSPGKNRRYDCDTFESDRVARGLFLGDIAEVRTGARSSSFTRAYERAARLADNNINHDKGGNGIENDTDGSTEGHMGGDTVRRVGNSSTEYDTKTYHNDNNDHDGNNINTSSQHNEKNEKENDFVYDNDVNIEVPWIDDLCFSIIGSERSLELQLNPSRLPPLPASITGIVSTRRSVQLKGNTPLRGPSYVRDWLCDCLKLISISTLSSFDLQLRRSTFKRSVHPPVVLPFDSTSLNNNDSSSKSLSKIETNRKRVTSLSASGLKLDDKNRIEAARIHRLLCQGLQIEEEVKVSTGSYGRTEMVTKTLWLNEEESRLYIGPVLDDTNTTNNNHNNNPNYKNEIDCNSKSDKNGKDDIVINSHQNSEELLRGTRCLDLADLSEIRPGEVEVSFEPNEWLELKSVISQQPDADQYFIANYDNDNDDDDERKERLLSDSFISHLDSDGTMSNSNIGISNDSIPNTNHNVNPNINIDTSHIANTYTNKEFRGRRRDSWYYRQNGDEVTATLMNIISFNHVISDDYGSLSSSSYTDPSKKDSLSHAYLTNQASINKMSNSFTTLLSFYESKRNSYSRKQLAKLTDSKSVSSNNIKIRPKSDRFVTLLVQEMKLQEEKHHQQGNLRDSHASSNYNTNNDHRDRRSIASTSISISTSASTSGTTSTSQRKSSIFGAMFSSASRSSFSAYSEGLPGDIDDDSNRPKGMPEIGGVFSSEWQVVLVGSETCVVMPMPNEKLRNKLLRRLQLFLEHWRSNHHIASDEDFQVKHLCRNKDWSLRKSVTNLYNRKKH